jgi:hypothetical protein
MRILACLLGVLLYPQKPHHSVRIPYHEDYESIEFLIYPYEYSVFHDYDASERKRENYGVSISRGGDELSRVNCLSPVVDNMTEVLKRLKCDQNNALRCGAL